MDDAGEKEGTEAAGGSEARPGTEGLHHVTMVARNGGRTLAFYRDLLGLRLVKRTVNHDVPDSWHLYFAAGDGEPGTILTHFIWPDVRKGRWGVGGVHHVALGVGTEEALLKWKRRLDDRGVPVSGPYDRHYFTSIYFADPDGQILEIATEGPGYTVDEPADALGAEVKRPPEETLRGERDEEAIAARTHPEPVEEVTPEMALDGIHHVSGITGALEPAHDFLTEALGLSLVKRTVNRDAPDVPHWFWARRDGSGVRPRSAYTLFGWPDSRHDARAGFGQTHHIAFRAADADEQLAMRERLLSLGVDVTPVIDRSYFRSVYFRAPDGQLIEIATDGPGFARGDEPGEQGEALALPEHLEPRRAEIEAALPPLE